MSYCRMSDTCKVYMYASALGDTNSICHMRKMVVLTSELKTPKKHFEN